MLTNLFSSEWRNTSSQRKTDVPNFCLFVLFCFPGWSKSQSSLFGWLVFIFVFQAWGEDTCSNINANKSLCMLKLAYFSNCINCFFFFFLHKPHITTNQYFPDCNRALQPWENGKARKQSWGQNNLFWIQRLRISVLLFYFIPYFSRWEINSVAMMKKTSIYSSKTQGESFANSTRNFWWGKTNKQKVVFFWFGFFFF